MASNFDFLRTSRPEFHESATEAEQIVHIAPRGACVTARFCLERAVNWLYANDSGLRPPCSDKLADLIYEQTFTENLAHGLQARVQQIHKLGNIAAHRAQRVRTADAVNAVQSLHAFLFWLASYYGEQKGVLTPAAFNPALLPQPTTQAPRRDLDQAQITALEKRLAAREAELAASRESLQEQVARAEARVRELNAAHETAAAARAEVEAHQALLGENVVALDAAQREIQAKAAALAEREAELARARAEVAALHARHEAERTRLNHLRTQRAAANPLTFDEAETRAQLIDTMLREAGWDVDDPANLEVAVTFDDGSPGRADYAFFSTDGRPLAVIEAKRAREDLALGKTQALLYADALEREHGRRPVIFYSNGLDVALWDDARGYPPRRTSGFYTPAEVETLISRRQSELPLAPFQPDPAIAGREYQLRALKAITEAFDRERRRRALVVMATGTGKTRVAVALVELLQRAGWARRVLFLADRVALVRQATGAFRKHLPHATVVDLTVDDDTGGAPVVVATYPTMLGAIEKPKDGRRRYSPGAFDLVILDEAHRSIYQRYGALLDYFDGRLLGLTATPRDEVDRDTYALFQLETDLPTFAYELDDAVKHGHLVPPRGKVVPFRFLTQGITYESLSDRERAEYEDKLTDDDGQLPEAIDPAVLNRWLFNLDTIDQALKYILENGIRIDSGERLGKTIIFARSIAHARLIVERYDLHYPKDAGKVAAVIVSKDTKAHTLLEHFSDPQKNLNIAVSVDMLDTGVDIPEVVNLVFFRPVFSKTKFHQMLGRGTRTCKDLFGPGDDKTEFLVFDLCGVLDFFKQNLPERTTPLLPSPSTRLFRGRLDLARRLGEGTRTPGEAALLTGLRDDLRRTVAGMHRDNFFVRPVWPLVQRFAERARWDKLTEEDHRDLLDKIAALPSDAQEDDPQARDFDLRCVALQLAILGNARTLPTQIAAMITIATALLDQKQIPQIAAELAYIQHLEAEETWTGATLEMVEEVRRRLRSLVRFIDKDKREHVYTNFKDQLLTAADAEVPVYAAAGALYRRRVTQFIRDHRDHLAIAKLRANHPLTATDLQALEQLLLQPGVGETREALTDLYRTDGNLDDAHRTLPAFIRSLVGLDPAAASAAFGAFLNAPGRALNVRQQNFIRQIIDYLTNRGVMPIAALYDPPFTHLSATGPDGLFTDPEVTELIAIIQSVNATATPPAANTPGRDEERAT
jgi:type I restriction enzyme R subunit